MATWSNVLLGVCDAPCGDLLLSPYENKIGGYPVSFNSLLVLVLQYTQGSPSLIIDTILYTTRFDIRVDVGIMGHLSSSVNFLGCDY